MSEVAGRYRQTNARVLAAVQDLSNEQLRWRPAPTAHSIGFVLWHLARYADWFQESVPRMTPELGRRLGRSRQRWDVESLAQGWGWPAGELGQAETGKGMDDATAARLPLPDREALLDYARRSFAAAERAMDAIDDGQFLSPVAPELGMRDTTVGRSVLANLVHNNQHLGEIWLLRGLHTAIEPSSVPPTVM